MHALSTGCSSRLGVRRDLTIRGSLPSLILQCLRLWPQVFEREHNLALNSALSVNMMVSTG